MWKTKIDGWINPSDCEKCRRRTKVQLDLMVARASDGSIRLTLGDTIAEFTPREANDLIEELDLAIRNGIARTR